MEIAGKRATMVEVGRAAGCHASTVSLALRGDVRIPEETRARVRSAARRLGYEVHPLVAAWVSARRSGRPVDRRLPLAYLTCHPENFRWKDDVHFASIFEGARDQAERYGFALTEFRLSDYGRDLQRLNQVLVTRNVRGLVVGPALAHHGLEGLDWSRYSLVTIGYGLTTPSLHRVTEDHHLGVKLAFEACLLGGHRRIGLALVRQHNAMRRERWIGAYLYEQFQNLAVAERLPIYLGEGATAVSGCKAWMRTVRPDIVLADDPSAWPGSGVPVLGFALPAAHLFPGVRENNRGIGGSAADLLVSLVLRNERGIPTGRQTVLVEPMLTAG